jgi:HK97 family phage portal protein
MANFIQKFIDRLIGKSVSGIGWMDSSNNDPFAIWASSKRVSPAKAMTVYNGWVYACVRAISEEIANMRWRLFEMKGDEATELFDHDILDLLNGVNEAQTGYELKYLMGSHLELAGNFYAVMDGVKAGKDGKPNGKPRALYPLNPAGVRVVVDHTQFPSRITKFEYTSYGKRYEFDPAEILHLKYPDPSDLHEGIGTAQSIPLWIDADNYAMEFNRRFFINGARIGGILESENTRTEAQLEFIKKSFEAIHKGYDSAYKTLILPKGTKYTQASESQKDMDFNNLMVMMRDRILAGFRVPRTVLGITDDVNRANAEATNYIFALRTIKPKMQLIVSYLNEFLVPLYGENLFLDFEDPVPENTELKVKEMAASVGVLSPNEQRERYFGYEPIDNADRPLAPLMMQPIGESIQPTKQNVQQDEQNKNKKRKKHLQTGSGARPSVKYAKAAKMRQGLTKDFTEKMVSAFEEFQKQQKEISQKSITDLTDKDWAVIYRSFETRVTPYIKLVANAMRKFNHGQKTRVLNNLERAIKSVKNTKGIDKAALFNLQNEIGITIDFVTPSLTDLYDKEGLEAGSLVGVDTINLPRQVLERSIELMAKSYNETTLDLLKSKLDQGISQGQSISELKDTISQIYEYSDESRAEMVARTEAFRTANLATKEAWKQSNVVTTIKWYTAEDSLVCPLCEPLDGKVISIDNNFFNQGDTAQGSDGSTFDVSYSDVETPPLHPDCRCYIRPEDLAN